MVRWGAAAAVRGGIVACAIALAGCRSCRDGEGEGASSLVAQPPVPAPADLVADVVLASPTTSWTRLQRALGGTVGLLPPSFASAAVLALGLDPVLATEVDSTTPAFAALAGDPTAPSWALAVRASDPRHARAVLAQGEEARYVAREVAGLVELVPKLDAGAPGDGRPRPVLGLTKNGYVVLASSSAALAALGPYATRTLPTRPLPPASAAVIDVSHETIRDVIAPRAQAAWAEQKQALVASDEEARRAHGGRAPDFGDPKAIVEALDGAFASRLALLADVEHARLSLDVGDEELRVAMTFTPMKGEGPLASWVRTMPAVEAKSALAMPATAVVAGAMRGVQDGEADAGALGGMFLETLAGRLSAADEKKVRDAMGEWSRARGDALAFAARWDAPRGVLVRAAVTDREAAARAMRTTVEAAGASPLDELLRVKSVRVSAEEVEPVGKVTLATFVRMPDPQAAAAPRAARPRREARDGGAGPAGPAGVPPVGVAWTIEGGTLVAAAGPEPLAAMRTMARPDKTLGEEPAVVRALGAGAPDAPDALEAVVVAQPFQLDERHAPLPCAPVTFTVGKKGGDAVVRLTAAYALLREAGRLQLMP